MHRHGLGLKDEVTDTVENDAAPVEFNAAHLMRPVPDNGVCPGINHGVCKGFEKLCGFVTLPCPHLVSMQAHENHVGLAACFLHFCRNAREVPAVWNRLHVFRTLCQTKLNVSELAIESSLAALMSVTSANSLAIAKC